MWPDRISNLGPLALESDMLRLRYVARLIFISKANKWVVTDNNFHTLPTENI